MTDIARRVGVLQDAGHGWLDPQSQVALAAAPTSDTQMVGQASAFRQALNDHAASQGTSLLGSISHWFGDPVLQKQPSAALQLRQYLLQKQGWAPIAEDDLRSIQQKLADAGYLDAADVNGVWTPAAQRAYSQATSDHVQQQQTHSGGFSIGQALSEFLPSHWIPALVGAAKALPGELRSLVAEIAGDVGATAYDFAHPVGFVPGTDEAHNASRYGSKFAAETESLLGKDQTPEQAQADESKRFINSINAMLTVAPVAKGAKAGIAGFDAARAAAANASVNDAAGVGFWRGMGTNLGPEAAQRGPGTISKLLYNNEGGGILRNRLIEQSPVSRFLAPPVRVIFSPDGKTVTHAYYAFRTAAATGYNYAGGQALGAAYANARFAGISEEAIKAVESKLGVHDSALKDQIHAAGLIGGKFGLALDLLDGGFHGPLHTSATLRAAQEGRQVLLPVTLNPSHTVTSLVQSVRDRMDAAMKPLNIGWAIQEGSKLGNKPTTLEEQIDKYGADFVHAYWNSKINQYAAAVHAEGALKDSGLARDSEAYRRAFEDASHEALHTPELLGPARDALLGDMVELQNKIAQDANRINREMDDEFRQGMDSYHAAWEPMSRLVANHATELVTPQALDVLSQAQKEHAFNQALAPDVDQGAAPIANRSFLDENHPGITGGSVGLARKRLPGQPEEVETQTERLMAAKAKEFQTRLDGAGSPVIDAENIGKQPAYNPDEIAAVKRDAINYLLHYRGLNPKELEGLDAQQLIDTIKDLSKRAPKDVTLALDASAEAREYVKQIEAAGFKVVAGTDIGHIFTPPVLDPVLIQGYKSKLRKLAVIMSVNNVPVSVEQSGTIRRILTERTLQEAINKGLIRVPPGMNGARLNMWILDNLEARAELTPGEKIAYAVGDLFGTHNAAARRVLGEDATAEQIAEWKQREQTLIANGTQPLEVAPKQIVKALTRETPQVIKDALGETGRLPLMDEKSAQAAADMYVRALLHEPAWAFGAGKLEDVMRAGFGFLGTRASESNGILRRLSRAGNASIRARNRYRFQLDPMFSMKRIAKTALKASIPGDHGVSAPVTVRPFAHMAEQGILNDAFNTLDRVYPMKSALGFDTHDRLLYEQDAFGLYNPRHHMALRAYHLEKAGLSDAEITKDLKRTFTYGDRSAFERSLGTIWYPFSFERTLWRNVGSYMLDHPGSRLLGTVAFDAYNALANSTGINEFMEQHFPVLNEFKKMNAFEHGIGPGQVGGINAMYAPALWNLFGPQKYAGSMAEPQLNALQNIFPVLRELNSLLVGESVYTGKRSGGTLTQQLGIGLWAAQHALDKATTIAGMGHALDGPFQAIGKILPVRSETYQAEQQKAWAYRNSLVMALAPVLDYNYHHRSGQKVWGPDAPASVRGKTVNRATIDEIVHGVYGSYDAAAAQSFAVEKKTQMDRYLSDLASRDPQRAAAYQQFTVPAEKLRPLLQRAVTDPAKYEALARVEQDFREYAINLAEQDPQFNTFYRQFYLSELGPIEAVTL